MNSFWHRVCRWITNNFYRTPTPIFTREACLPPIDVYCRHRSPLGALRLAWTPSTLNPAAARLPASFPSMATNTALDSSRHFTNGLSSYYLPLDWRIAVPSPPMCKHLPIDALAHLTLPLTGGISCFPLDPKTPPPAGENIRPVYSWLAPTRLEGSLPFPHAPSVGLRPPPPHRLQAPIPLGGLKNPTPPAAAATLTKRLSSMPFSTAPPDQTLGARPWSQPYRLRQTASCGTTQNSSTP